MASTNADSVRFAMNQLESATRVLARTKPHPELRRAHDLLEQALDALESVEDDPGMMPLGLRWDSDVPSAVLTTLGCTEEFAAQCLAHETEGAVLVWMPGEDVVHELSATRRRAWTLISEEEIRT